MIKILKTISSFFQPDGPMAPQLADVLEAYVCYRPDIGYVQGVFHINENYYLNFKNSIIFFSSFRACLI